MKQDFTYNSIHFERLAVELESLVIYQEVLSFDIMQRFIALLYVCIPEDEYDEEQIKLTYSEWSRSLLFLSSSANWKQWLAERILLNAGPANFNERLREDSWLQAWKNEVHVLMTAMQLNGFSMSRVLSDEFKNKSFPCYDSETVQFSEADAYSNEFKTMVLALCQWERPNDHKLLEYFRNFGSGPSSQYKFLKQEGTEYFGLKDIPQSMSHSYFIEADENAKEAIQKNVQAFLNEKSYDHIFIADTRGDSAPVLPEMISDLQEEKSLRFLVANLDDFSATESLMSDLRNSPLHFILLIEENHNKKDKYFQRNLNRFMAKNLSSIPENVMFIVSVRSESKEVGMEEGFGLNLYIDEKLY